MTNFDIVAEFSRIGEKRKRSVFERQGSNDEFCWMNIFWGRKKKNNNEEKKWYIVYMHIFLGWNEKNLKVIKVTLYFFN